MCHGHTSAEGSQLAGGGWVALQHPCPSTGRDFLQERQRACSQAGSNGPTVTLPCSHVSFIEWLKGFHTPRMEKSLSMWEAEEHFNACLVKSCAD